MATGMVFTEEPGKSDDQPSRIVWLDAAKGISILLVVTLHAGTPWQINEFFLPI